MSGDPEGREDLTALIVHRREREPMLVDERNHRIRGASPRHTDEGDVSVVTLSCILDRGCFKVADASTRCPEPQDRRTRYLRKFRDETGTRGLGDNLGRCRLRRHTRNFRLGRPNLGRRSRRHWALGRRRITTASPDTEAQDDEYKRNTTHGTTLTTSDVAVLSDTGTVSHVTRLCVLGDFAWDVLIRTNSELLRGGDTFGEVMLTPGGSAANVAVWARRCGLDTSFVGKIGRDRFGQLADEDLRREGVHAHFVETDVHPTGSVAVFVDHTGQRSMVSGHGADFYLMPSEVPVGVISGSDHLHLTAWSFFTDPPRSAARRAARLAQQSGATVSFDPGSFQMIQEMGVEHFLATCADLDVDIVLPNKEEAQVLTGCDEPHDMARAMAKIFPGALVVLKLDADGALVLDGDAVAHIPPATNKLVDATGAGDSFAGAFLAHYLVHRSPVAAARFATRVSAWVIEHIGARPAPDSRLATLTTITS